MDVGFIGLGAVVIVLHRPAMHWTARFRSRVYGRTASKREQRIAHRLYLFVGAGFALYGMADLFIKLLSFKSR
jgi:hypothetical protein